MEKIKKKKKKIYVLKLLTKGVKNVFIAVSCVWYVFGCGKNTGINKLLQNRSLQTSDYT